MEEDDGQIRGAAAQTAQTAEGAPVMKEALPVEQVTEEAPRADESATVGDMQSLLDDSERRVRSIHRGEVLEGIVAQVDREGILIDLGTKSEGIIPGPEAQRLVNEHALDVGDDVVVFVVQSEDEEGRAVLSWRRARSESGWRAAQLHFENRDIFIAEVIDQNSGGLIVNADGIHGFVPMSQVVSARPNGTGGATEHKPPNILGQKIYVKVLEVDRKRNRLILSERLAVQERRGQRKDQLLSELTEGEVRHGRVSSLCDFGAFVDIGGADGLVHLSELSWSQVAHPRDVLNVGDEVDVYVLSIDRERKKIALSIRRTQPEPWKAVPEKYAPGDVVTGTVSRLVTFGAFVRIEDGIEGLIHISELSDEHVVHPRNVVREGDVVRVRILRVEPERRRIGLSLKQVDSDDEQL